MKYATFLAQAGIEQTALAASDKGGSLESRTPVDGSVLGKVVMDDAASVDAKLKASSRAFLEWRRVPGPRRGALVSAFAQRVREQKPALAALVSLESGKILTEGAGEVQEVIDICDFAVGLSRQLHGLTIASERPGHHLLERWQPLGPVAVITAFNFPMAVWAWNAMLALVCGDSVIWKPSEKTPLCAVALHKILEDVLVDFPDAPKGLSALVQGGRELGEQLVDSPAIALVSATGSTAMGRIVGPRVAARFGRTLLELGGNNAAIIGPTADLGLALRAIVFSAVGTAGQRCTSMRRLMVHKSIYDKLLSALKQSYAKLAIGSPMDGATLVGPLIDAGSFERMQQALQRAAAAGGRVTGGQRVTVKGSESGYYVQPAIVEMDKQLDVALEETFAPILYVMPYESFDDALALQNQAAHGLSSAIFTNDMREAETFVSVTGSDCGIANVNTGTSGAEIGGAFGGEKETGGGRESGSDAWKNYMRRQTQTINYSTALPLAQGVSFDL